MGIIAFRCASINHNEEKLTQSSEHKLYRCELCSFALYPSMCVREREREIVNKEKQYTIKMSSPILFNLNIKPSPVR